MLLIVYLVKLLLTAVISIVAQWFEGTSPLLTEVHMNESHPNLSNAIQETLLAGQAASGLKLTTIVDPFNQVIEVQTQNSVYRFVLLNPVQEENTPMVVQGGACYPEPRRGWFKGSSSGGSL